MQILRELGRIPFKVHNFGTHGVIVKTLKMSDEDLQKEGGKERVRVCLGLGLGSVSGVRVRGLRNLGNLGLRG